MSYAKNLMLQIPMATGGFEFYFKMQLGNLVHTIQHKDLKVPDLLVKGFGVTVLCRDNLILS